MYRARRTRISVERAYLCSGRRKSLTKEDGARNELIIVDLVVLKSTFNSDNQEPFLISLDFWIRRTMLRNPRVMPNNIGKKPGPSLFSSRNPSFSPPKHR